METYIKMYLDYLVNTKKASANTIDSYRRDLNCMNKYFEAHQVYEVSKINETNINSYILYLEKMKKSTSTISRNISSMKAFFMYLRENNYIEKMPLANIKPPRVERKLPGVLNLDEIMLLLEQPNTASVMGLRDKAMLELLYATGMRVSELIDIWLCDIDVETGFVVVRTEKKSRVIPITAEAKLIIKEYLSKSRPVLLKGKNTDKLFVNYTGDSISRQGFWKLIKKYAKEANIEKDITPQTLRHSFALHLAMNGADLKSLQDILGNSDLSSMQIYSQMAGNTVRDVYLKSHPFSKR